MSRLIAAVLRKSEPMPPRPPAFDTAAASSADVQEPIGARMIGTSIPNTSQRRVFNIAVSSLLQRHGRSDIDLDHHPGPCELIDDQQRVRGHRRRSERVLPALA